MRVLIITNHYLDGRGGGTTGSRGFINAFAAIYPDCLLIYPDNGHDVSKLIIPGLNAIGCPDKRPSWLKGAGIYFGRLHRFTALAKKTINSYKPDIVVFDTSTVSSGLIRFVKKAGIKTITIHHNVEKDYFRDNPPSWFIRYPYFFYIKRTERKAVQLSDLNLTHTDEDTNKLLEYYSGGRNRNIQYIGVLGTYKGGDYTRIELKEKKESKTVFVMTGNLSLIQSYSSFIDFIEKYLPVLIETCEDMELVIAGSNPSENLVRICESNKKIRLVPNPSDMMEILIRGDVYICPVDRGSGLKIRIMDGLKAGLPVLSHDVSSRGYEYFIETGFIHTYKSIPTFQSSLELILSTKPDRNTRIEQFRDYFSSENGVARMKKVIDQYLPK